MVDMTRSWVIIVHYRKQLNKNSPQNCNDLSKNPKTQVWSTIKEAANCGYRLDSWGIVGWFLAGVRYSALLRIVQTSCHAYPVSCWMGTVCVCVCACMCVHTFTWHNVTSQGMRLNSKVLLMPRLRMSWTVLLITRMPSWCAHRQIYCYLCCFKQVLQYKDSFAAI